MVLVLGHIKNGKLRPLGIAGKRRSPSLPDVPTFAESGVQYEVGSWWGVVAPAKTPAPIIERLHKEIVVALGNPEVKRKLEGEGGDPVGSSPAEFSAFIKAEAARWASVIRTAKIQPE